MTLPAIILNASTGSDTAASGAGPATALSGTAAATAASTLVTLSVDSPDLSGVATDGSAVLWVGSSSGRQFSKITAVNNVTKVVTVASAYANTESGKNWGIGGKRLDLNATSNRQLFADWATGWIVQLDSNHSISSAIAVAAPTTMPYAKITSTAGQRYTITQSANANHFDCSSGSKCVWFDNLTFVNSNGTKTSAFAIGFGSTLSWIKATNCIFGDSANTNNLKTGISRTSAVTAATVTASGCDFINLTANGIDGFWTTCTVTGCYFLCTTAGINVLFSGNGNIIVRDSIFSGGVNAILVAGTNMATLLEQNIFDGASGSGVDFSAGDPTVLHLRNNQFSNNGAYGFRGSATIDNVTDFADYNNYYLNTSGARNNLTAGANDTATDPAYTDRAGKNFTVGPAMKAAGSPISTRNIGAGSSTTPVGYDVGLQRAESGGGGLSAPTNIFGAESIQVG